MATNKLVTQRKAEKNNESNESLEFDLEFELYLRGNRITRKEAVDLEKKDPQYTANLGIFADEAQVDTK